MAELIFWALDYSTDPTKTQQQLCSLPKVYDLLDIEPDGFSWGNDELNLPCFRIIVWSGIDPVNLEPYLGYQQATWPAGTSNPDPNNPQTFFLFRKQFINFSDTKFISFAPAGWQQWWNDNTRTQKKFLLPANFSILPNQIEVIRTTVNNPAFVAGV